MGWYVEMYGSDEYDEAETMEREYSPDKTCTMSDSGHHCCHWDDDGGECCICEKKNPKSEY